MSDSHFPPKLSQKFAFVVYVFFILSEGSCYPFCSLADPCPTSAVYRGSFYATAPRPQLQRTVHIRQSQSLTVGLVIMARKTPALASGCSHTLLHQDPANELTRLPLAYAGITINGDHMSRFLRTGNQTRYMCE